MMKESSSSLELACSAVVLFLIAEAHSIMCNLLGSLTPAPERVVQDQLVAQKAETKKLSEQIATVTEKPEALQQSVADIPSASAAAPPKKPRQRRAEGGCSQPFASKRPFINHSTL
jgi:hypothetical protein